IMTMLSRKYATPANNTPSVDLIRPILDSLGLEKAARHQNITPEDQRAIEADIQYRSEFMSMVNSVRVSKADGPAMQMGPRSPIAARTDVDNNDRQVSLIARARPGYECVSTEFDAALAWADVDAWGPSDDYAGRVKGLL